MSNSLNNLSNLVTIPNNVLQGDLSLAGINTGRLLINTTIGILGIFDVAQLLGIVEYEKEDYGQSLAKAGVGPGCYIVLHGDLYWGYCSFFRKSAGGDPCTILL